MDYRTRFRGFYERTGSYVFGGEPLDFTTFCTYLRGFEAADQASFLGFREFCVLRLDDGNNLTWEALVLHLALPPGWKRPLTAQQDQVAVDYLAALLDEFFAEVGDSLRLRQEVLIQHHFWLQRQPWWDTVGSQVRGAYMTDRVNTDEAAARIERDAPGPL